MLTGGAAKGARLVAALARVHGVAASLKLGVRGWPGADGTVEAEGDPFWELGIMLVCRQLQ